MKIAIWGKQYPLRLDTRDLHLSFPGIETMERNKAKDSDLDYLSFSVEGRNYTVRLAYDEYGLKALISHSDSTDLQFLFDNFDRAEKFGLFFRNGDIAEGKNQWTGSEMEVTK